MQSISNIGIDAYEPAPRGESLRKLQNGGAERRGTLDKLRYAFACMMDFSTFLLLLVPILIGYLIRLFVPAKKKKIAGQLALVTGGANGLGRELCLQLAMKGCHIVVADLDTTNGEKTAEDLRKLGVKAKCFKADISDYDSVVELKRQVESSLGNVDILVNNAGVLPLMSIREGKPEDLKKVMEINLLSHFWTIRVFVEGMAFRRKGHIISIASASSYLPVGRLCSYVASKYGVRGLMEAFNDELYFDGLHEEVFTTTVYPTFMNTRKDLINTLNTINILKRVPIISAKTIARTTVNAMLRNEQHVFFPKWFGFMLTHYEHVPCEIRRLARRIFLKREIPKLMK
ncbi:estradiol 17-beta-dehydrogenase 11-like isoform X1 [Topomyia yanbarensis]|uniref:estradiol 17-beta-dehydrogenase 11-like isoform X1 n=1 Tax=Topomyia yanbarensis TaxID=2498891 RepID=UPI00273B6087|nr:estradiol 17-beta-dehydrogenase 11-like isoform X1 [Topomyia yanbarensis]